MAIFDFGAALKAPLAPPVEAKALSACEGALMCSQGLVSMWALNTKSLRLLEMRLRPRASQSVSTEVCSRLCP